VASYVSRDEDVRLVKELVFSRIIPRRKLGYMKKNVYRAGVSSGLQS
jgi:hypothetical protein